MIEQSTDKTRKMTNSAKYTLQYLVSAGGGKTECEDRVGMFENVCWVLDGASLPPGLTNEFGHSTLWYVKTLGIELSNAVYAGHPDTPLADILSAALCAIKGRLEKRTREETFLPSSTVILLRVNLLELEYLVLGDSYLAIDAPEKLECISDQRISRVATDLRKRSENQPETVLSNEMWTDLVLEELSFRNKPNGYWIASDDPDVASHAIVGRRTMEPGSRTLAMTDGFAAVHTAFGLYRDWSEVVRASAQDGLNTVLTNLRAAQRSRSLQGGPTNSRSSDDASALLIEWHE